MMILGMDPSMSNWGFSLCELDLATMKIRVEELLRVKTIPSKIKGVRKNCDDLDRARVLQEGLGGMLPKANLVCVEMPHGSQSADAMKSYGMCLGLLAGVQMPLIQMNERDLKEATVGSHKCTKREMIEWIAERHPEADWPLHRGKIANTAEHMADATAAIYAGLKTQDFKNAMVILKHMQKVA